MVFKFTQPQNEIIMCMLKRLLLMLPLTYSLSMVSKLCFIYAKLVHIMNTYIVMVHTISLQSISLQR